MNRHQYEEMCRKSRVHPVKRIDAEDGIILISDSGALDLRDLRKVTDRRDHYCTLWAFGKDEENLMIGQALYFDAFFEDDGIWRATTEEIRVAAAEQTARDWLHARSNPH